MINMLLLSGFSVFTLLFIYIKKNRKYKIFVKEITNKCICYNCNNNLKLINNNNLKLIYFGITIIFKLFK